MSTDLWHKYIAILLAFMAVVLFIAAWTLSWTLSYIQEDVASIAREARKTSVVTCYEDEPCWECSTMGNRLCGPQVSTP